MAHKTLSRSDVWVRLMPKVSITVIVITKMAKK